MKQLIRLVFATCILTALALPAQAQEWSAEQQEVWQVVSQQWELEVAEDLSWLELLHDSFQGWPIGAPNPYDKADVERYFSVEAGQARIVWLDLSPVEIVVAGDTAVVHFFHTVLEETPDGERDFVAGRSTDVLTRTDDGWRILSAIGREVREEEL